MIIANFCHGRTEVSVYDMWQYDYGQKIRIQGLDLPTAVEVHFSLNVTGGESVTRIGVTRDRVTEVVVPDSMLVNNDATHDYWLYAFIYVANSESGQTEYKISLRVKSRPRPEAFDTPEDAELFRETIAAVNAAADRAEESENNAKESEEKAEGYLAASHTLAKQMAADKKTVTDLAGEVGENRNTVEQLASATAANAETVAENKATVEQMAERVKSDSEKVEKDKAEVKALALEMETQAKEVASNMKQVEEDASAVAADKAQVEEKAERVSSNAETVKKHTEDVEANTEKVEKLAEDVNSNAAKVASDKEAVIDIVNNAAQKVTPYIGENGNWFIDGEDTGKPSGGVSSWNDLEDRPFYEEKDISYVIKNFTFGASELSNGGIATETQTLLEIGKIYKFNVNGAVRSYVARDFAGIVYIGNPYGTGGTDDGFPYGFAQISGSTEGEFLAFKKPTEGSFVVSIEGDTTTVTHTLEAKFVEGMYYEEGERKEIFPLTTAVVGELSESDLLAYMPDDGMFIFSANLTLDIKVGKTYVVSMNGAEYSCVATYVNIDGIQAVALGDVYTAFGGEFGSTPTGEPFMAMFLPSGMSGDYSGMGMLLIEPPSELTIGISGSSEIHKIPSKFLDLDWLPIMNETPVTKFTFDGEVPSQGLITTANGDHSGFFEVKNGEKYTVTINDDVYECVGVTLSYESATMCYLGNMGLADSSRADTGEPFLFSIYCENGEPQSTSALNFTEEYWETEVHMKVDGYVYTPNKIPSKYLPDTFTDMFDFTHLGTVSGSIIGDNGTLAQSFYNYVKENGKARIKVHSDTFGTTESDYDFELNFIHYTDDSAEYYKGTVVNYIASSLANMFVVTTSYDGTAYMVAISIGQLS